MRMIRVQHRPHPWRWTAALASLVVVGVALLVGLAVIPALRAEAANLVVNSTVDPGAGACDAAECTLREAIAAANATGDTDTITFDIPGPGPHTIVLGSALPNITDDNLTIDGGAEVVIIQPGGAWPGLVLAAGSSNASIRNLVLDGGGVGTYGILVHDDTDGHQLVNLDIKDWTRHGIFFDDTSADLATTASDGNLITDTLIHDIGDGIGDDNGIVLDHGTGNTITSSEIYSNDDDGMEINGGTDLKIIGDDIFSNGDHGVNLSNTTGTTINSNIGIVSNGLDGVHAVGDLNLVITDNQIAGNGASQIELDSVNNATILRNDMVAGSDAIVLEDTIADPANILVGGSAADRNRFRGIAVPGPCNTEAANCYVQLNGGVGTTVTATHNDWGTTDTGAATGIPTLVCHQGEGTCGNGLVNFADPEPPGGSPILPATPTPTSTLTPTTTPTETPTPGPSPTATSQPEEILSLAIGCNFVASTYPDDTEPAALASVVSPLASLAGLWAQQPPPSWAGYSPAFPEVSDMGPVDKLDVIAICMTTSGTFSRPII
jgi:CSLREA domain-containing protein